MLKIQVNKKDAVPNYRKLEPCDGFNEVTASFYTDSGTGENFISLSHVKTGGMSVGDRIRFVRKDCDGNIVFTDFTTIVGVHINTVVIKPLPDIKLGEATKKWGIRKFPNGNKINGLEIGGTHCFIDNPEGCNIDIKENIIGNYTEYDKSKRRCVGDYVLYEGRFFYVATDVTDENKYVISTNPLNKVVRIKLINGIVAQRYKGRHGTIGNDWETDKSGEFIWLNNCIVPVDGEGKNTLNKIFWEGVIGVGNSAISDAIPDGDVFENGLTTFACENQRYYVINNNDSSVTILDGTEIFFEESCIKISGVLDENFDVNLFQRDALNKKYFFKKNKTIDYEKQIFYPVYQKEENEEIKLKDVSTISYNIYFRQREGIKQPLTEEQAEEYEEKRKIWKIDESKKWNITGLNNKQQNGDLVGFAGFDDNDIYYQKKKVGMSFLRLSLYDTKDRLTQSLLGYSTIFLDSTALYKKYVMKKNTPTKEQWKNYYMVFRGDSPCLDLNFSCSNKYNSDRSSEGFYLYLFPSLLETQEKDEEGWNTIYMKAEFNNAKYGKTVPFILPHTYNGMPKDDYVVQDPLVENNTYVDMVGLFDDMYIKIKIKYDESSKRYVWRFYDYNSTEIVINLFEPKVNR